MVKLSIPWDKDKDKSSQAGTSFTPSFTGRPKTAPSASSSFPSLRRFTTDPSTTVPTIPPLLHLKLSSPSFLDSVVHDGTSDNPLYVIETEDNTTKIRRSDQKGFVNVARVRWRLSERTSRKAKQDLTGVQVSFGKGQWKPADEFLGYSYGSLSSYRKFYLPHHPHSMRWKRVGQAFFCTTENVKGPVAILDPALLTAPPQLRIFDPLFRQDHSRPQRSHSGLPLSLLDFLLVTAMLLVTPSDEWTNVTREGPSAPFPVYESLTTPEPDAADISSLSASLPPSPKKRHSTGSVHSLSSTTSSSAISAPNVAVPVIERWRHAVPAVPPEEEHVRESRRRRGPGSTSSQGRDSAPSRATSRSSLEMDAVSVPPSPSTTTHYTASQHYAASQHSHQSTQSHKPSRGTPFSLRSASSVSVGSQNRYYAASIASRELPQTPQLPQHPHGAESPPLPPLPPTIPIPIPSPSGSVLSRTYSQYATSPSPSVYHSRSLPVPPTPGPPPTPGGSSVAKPPLPPPPPPPVPFHSQSRPHLHQQYQQQQTPHQHPHAHAPSPLSPLGNPHSYASDPRVQPLPEVEPESATFAYSPQTKVPPPGYIPSSGDEGGSVSGDPRQPLSIRTTDVGGVVRRRNAPADEGPIDSLYDHPPPAYSAIDHSRSPVRLRAVNADPSQNS
ncbi:hypothetical protein BV25DRAFT_1994034 [Artomyces pyxidatus]|uniref:Uncharacterized protein n=1 Tax=Artomyces pyxidatus TaxID=48021 RepID=A0ACB8SQE8_9AGAM|nr:hypothetical protein BV25DRAFT_1994034 [Artomyces pyxidatus]